MALLATQVVVEAGLAPAFVAAAGGGDTFAPGEDVYLHVKNGSGAGITVTIDSVTPCNQGVDHNLVVVVPAAGERLIGPFPAQRYASTTTGLVSVTYSGVTSLTVAAIKV